MAKIVGIFCGRRTDTEVFSEDDAARVAEQLERDATYGTFGSIPSDFWNSPGDRQEFEEVRNEIVDSQGFVEEQNGEWTRCRFELFLSDELFNVEKTGLQHLLGVVAGDLFSLSIPPLKIENLTISVDADNLINQTAEVYREPGGYNIDGIRDAFELGDHEPLLAFSIKPRLGLQDDELRRVVREVAEAGFHIIEPDTRYLDVSEGSLDEYLRLAEQVAEIGERNGIVSRFAPNLSVDSNSILEHVGPFLDEIPSPSVVKIDGGLDGLSAIQMLKSEFQQDSPIVTCYPLLRYSLPGGSPFISFLAASGADILYPGSCPRLRSPGVEEGGTRVIDREDVRKGLQHYDAIQSRGWPMPTVAGGVHAGKLHTYYELMGPNVAYFIGGGVSLHRDGPGAGARLCKRCIREAIDLRQNLNPGEVENFDFEGSLTRTEERYYSPPSLPEGAFDYVPPSMVFDKPQIYPFHDPNNRDI